MLTIKFFSLIREALDTDELLIEQPEGVTTLDALKHYLVRDRDEAWSTALFHPNVVHAVNQKVVNPETPIADGDEIAFFPPMTGG